MKRNTCRLISVVIVVLLILTGCFFFKKAPLPDSSNPSFVNTVGMSFVLIPAAPFYIMGSRLEEAERSGEEAQYKVVMERPFYMQTTEVTQDQWNEVMGTKPSFFRKCGGTCPVEQVSWNEVQQFIEKLNTMENTKKYRLPTEAEWEYACRAGTTTPFSTGACIGADQANYNGNYSFAGCAPGDYKNETVSTGGMAPNPWGLYDMHGNVYEWCQDWKGPYAGKNTTNPEGPSKGTERVIRGGAWNSQAYQLRTAARAGCAPASYTPYIGFRLVSIY
ncbi:MAG: formylglycine-generating enzyme family protein [Deltaproteobacteria bacterium]|nr:formylglycine-generating enzyme family protein [Deltaproteobacteria bacterium]